VVTLGTLVNLVEMLDVGTGLEEGDGSCFEGFGEVNSHLCGPGRT